MRWKGISKFMIYARNILRVHLLLSLAIFIFAKPLEIDRSSLLTQIELKKSIIYNISKEFEIKKTLVKPHVDLQAIQNIWEQILFKKRIKTSLLAYKIFKPPIFS